MSGAVVSFCVQIQNIEKVTITHLWSAQQQRWRNMEINKTLINTPRRYIKSSCSRHLTSVFRLPQPQLPLQLRCNSAISIFLTPLQWLVLVSASLASSTKIYQSYRQDDCLPILEGGDVEIRLSRRPEDRLVLHSIILILHSPWFKMSLSETWTKGEQAGPREYVLEFDFDEEGSACLVKKVSEIVSGTLLELLLNSDRTA